MATKKQQQLVDDLQQQFAEQLINITLNDVVTVELSRDHLLSICTQLRDLAPFRFEQLVDLCGVDYLEYGQDEWRTAETTASGFSRGTDREQKNQRKKWHKARYAVVYHLLSYEHNQRLRLKVYLEPEPSLPSVIDIWPSANWYERETYDLFGIVFDGHPDLRRLLTDYGFIGHPLRKDFPLIGQVEMRYDAAKGRCLYEPVSIQPRVLVPKVIRSDNRYLNQAEEESSNG